MAIARSSTHKNIPVPPFSVEDVSALLSVWVYLFAERFTYGHAMPCWRCQYIDLLLLIHFNCVWCHRHMKSQAKLTSQSFAKMPKPSQQHTHTYTYQAIKQKAEWETNAEEEQNTREKKRRFLHYHKYAKCKKKKECGESVRIITHTYTETDRQTDTNTRFSMHAFRPRHQ